jgi:putative endonuclease
MFYTYVLQSLLDFKFYAGFTHDLKLRLKQHESGQVESTRDRRPLKLIYYEACINKEDAIKREKYFKTYNGKFYIKKRLKSYLTG